MELSVSEQAILKKVDLIYSKSDSKLTFVSSKNSFYFKEIESIKIEKGIPTLFDKIKFWFFVLTDDSNSPNKARRNKLDYRYAKAIVLKLNNGETLRVNHTAFDLISTSKIIKKINTEINTPFKYRV